MSVIIDTVEKPCYICGKLTRYVDMEYVRPKYRCEGKCARELEWRTSMDRLWWDPHEWCEK